MTRISEFDVFLSYAAADRDTAELVADSLHNAGLDVFNPRSVATADDLSDIFWKALAESAALVVVVSPERAPASSIGVEIGAAAAWHKPIFIVHTSTGSIQFPSYLMQYKTYPLSRIDDVALEIRRGLEVLSDDEKRKLIQAYSELGIPADRLLGEPSSIEKLARAFRSSALREVPGERLMRELINLRKRGLLPTKRKTEEHHHTA